MRRSTFALALASVAFAAGHAACGSRSALRIDGARPSAAFCASSTYEAGFDEVALYLLFDKSESMDADLKWDQATAAIATLVDDPALAGIGFGMQLFPLGSSCDTSKYALPAVPILELPGNAKQVKSVLASYSPSGSTPTRPALRGALEYVRGYLLGNPSTSVAIAIVTDGAPNTCDSTVDSVVREAKGAYDGDPQILTYVIGLETGYLADMARIAEAGGTGGPVVIGKDASAAKQLATTLKSVLEAQQGCAYALPAVAAHVVSASDVTVLVDRKDGAGAARVDRVDGPALCAAADGYYFSSAALDAIELCPTSCARLRAAPGSVVSVTAGCAGEPPGDAPPPIGGGCPGVTDFQCIPKCGDIGGIAPDCRGGLWTCPQGTIANTSCFECPAVPHGCCRDDGTLAASSCLDGAWVCPPGARLFGEPGCTAPEVCTALLPCAAGQVCTVADFSCGLGDLLGTCLGIPSACPGGGPYACGCDGKTYESPCDAAAASLDLAPAGGCVAPSGTFECGPLFCDTASRICKKTLDLTQVLGNERYACIAPPPACPSGCGCAQCEPCTGSSCLEACFTDGATGGRHLTCTVL